MCQTVCIRTTTTMRDAPVMPSQTPNATSPSTQGGEPEHNNRARSKEEGQHNIWRAGVVNEREGKQSCDARASALTSNKLAARFSTGTPHSYPCKSLRLPKSEQTL
ncbi:uncharacterized protein B0H18DRAFT_1008423 [Fomitopsis serialis]|uniref:uncharacterized protein n=1 Tax=Fomitopsis serialis TaxID=139415 RepID=UPI0020075A11|nr:uncharacterized protein B0H18DRAFT_1008423 [Neoantrodia serialis]KAH9925803.1 hypothetical protein B0H18DRAFT_1008423 [Neoantrodia serialis]